jgi:branched-chain amino acid transport system permease protein
VAGNRTLAAFGPALAAIAGVVALPVVLPTYTLATLVLVFAIAALGCNLLLDYTGLMSFGQGIFFGFGAYGAALLLLRLDVPLLPAMAAAVVMGASIAAGVGFLAIRRRGVYFVLLTFAFAEMFAFLVYALSGLTGGENGLRGVPRPPVAVGGVTLLPLDDPLAMYAFVGVLFVLTYVFLLRVTGSPFGSTLRAIKDNEDRARAVGYDTDRFKVLAFAISGAVTALAGSLYALLLRSVPDAAMQVGMSQNILIMTIVGGTGSLYGSLFGAFGVTVLSDTLSYVWPRWRIILGLALIALVTYFQGGLWGAAVRLGNWLRRRRVHASTHSPTRPRPGREKGRA